MLAYKIIKKEIPAQVLFYDSCKIFQSSFPQNTCKRFLLKFQIILLE